MKFIPTKKEKNFFQNDLMKKTRKSTSIVYIKVESTKLKQLNESS